MKTEKLTEIMGQENKAFMEAWRFCTYGIFAMLNINSDVVTWLYILMCLDMCFGLVKSLRLGIKLEIGVLLWGFGVKLSLIAIPLVVAIMGKALQYNFTWAVDLAVKALVVNEAFSIFANILSIKNKKHIENFDFITLFVNLLRDRIINFIKNKYE